MSGRHIQIVLRMVPRLELSPVTAPWWAPSRPSPRQARAQLPDHAWPVFGMGSSFGSALRIARALAITASEFRLLHALPLDAGGATTCEVCQRPVWGPGGRYRGCLPGFGSL